MGAAQSSKPVTDAPSNLNAVRPDGFQDAPVPVDDRLDSTLPVEVQPPPALPAPAFCDDSAENEANEHTTSYSKGAFNQDASGEFVNLDLFDTDSNRSFPRNQGILPDCFVLRELRAHASALAELHISPARA